MIFSFYFSVQPVVQSKSTITYHTYHISHFDFFIFYTNKHNLTQTPNNLGSGSSYNYYNMVSWKAIYMFQNPSL